MKWPFLARQLVLKVALEVGPMKLDVLGHPSPHRALGKLLDARPVGDSTGRLGLSVAALVFL